MLKSDEEEKAVEDAIVTAIESTNRTYVDEMKAATEDGKLTEAEKKEAMAKSLSTASSVLSSKGLKIAGNVLNHRIEHKISEIKDHRLESNTRELLDAVKLAVSATHQTYVDAIKKARADGKLTRKEKEDPMQMAFKASGDMLRQKGIFVATNVLRSYIEAEIYQRKMSANTGFSRDVKK